MKNTTKHISILFLSLALFFGGCGTLSDIATGDGPLTAIEAAAFIGTGEALYYHPEWLDDFQKARDDLLLLESLDVVSYDDLLSIVNRLPVEAMRSERAVLYISAARLLLKEQNRPSLDLGVVADLKPYAAAIRRGIEAIIGPAL